MNSLTPKIVRSSSNDANFRELVTHQDNELNSRYGVIQEQYNKFNKIESLDTVVIGYMGDKPAGCGCFKEFDTESVEIKRMFVKPKYRGTGIAKMMLLELEHWAIEKGYLSAVLETGIKQPEAIRFYTKLGYMQIDNYGQYIGNANSMCMSKKLK